tara:strand:- start:1723 stop:2802 length:1080 start_codon:yes stop_codon:yes gene_type:complete
MDKLLNQISSSEVSLQISLIFGLGFLLIIIKNWLIQFLTGITKNTKNEFDDIILESVSRPFSYLIITISLLLIFDTLNSYYNYIESFMASNFFYSVFLVLLALSLVKFLDKYYENKLFLKKLSKQDDPVVVEQTYEITIRVSKIVIIVITLLILMQEFGLSISGLLAFGGVGGLVVGLAAKDLLSNFFGGLMIYFDRPFKVGEFIKSPDRNIEGIVESIGWRLTVVRTFSKNVLYIPNSAFSNIIVENATRMTNRRFNEVIGVRYEDIDNIPNIVIEVRSFLESHSDIDQTIKPVVYFTSFEASSCDIIVYAFTNTKDWRQFLEVKEGILFKIADIISSNNSAIAFPTTTIDWEKKLSS